MAASGGDRYLPPTVFLKTQSKVKGKKEACEILLIKIRSIFKITSE
jgi:hypothetical protein